jgi:sulfur carrier protein
MPLLRVTVNGEPHDVPAGWTLEALLQHLGLSPHEVASALNGEFVPRPLRTTRILLRGDSITCFRPITGG